MSPPDGQRFVVDAAGAGSRADKWLGAQLGGRGRRALGEAFAAGAVRVNGTRARKGQLLAAGDVVEVSGSVAPTGGAPPVPEPELPLVVVHEDERLVVVDKPAAMATHPLEPDERGTLANAVVARYPGCAGASAAPREGGAAHRLDAGTSGLVVFARDRAAWDALRAAFAAGAVEKRYLALVAAAVSRAGELDMPIAQRGRKVIIGDIADALPAVTRWRPLAAVGEHTLVEVSTETGRMHQVRAHLAFAGLPIVGDTLYGGPPVDGPGFRLHASSIMLPHPAGDRVTYEATRPPWARI